MKRNALHLHNLCVEEPGLVPSLNSREHILSLHLLNGHYSSIHLFVHSIICIFLNQLLSTEFVLNTMVGIQFSWSVRSDYLWPHGLQHDRLPCPNHVLRVSDAIKPSHPLSSLSPPSFNFSQHQGLFQWISSLHQVATVLEFQLRHQSFQWIFRTDFL